MNIIFDSFSDKECTPKNVLKEAVKEIKKFGKCIKSKILQKKSSSKNTNSSNNVC